MGRSFGRVMEKIAEAEFFLERMRSEGTSIHKFRYYFSAFVSAARSVTFALNAAMSNVRGFSEWYATKQRQLNANPLARFFVARRNEVQKIGDSRINVGLMRCGANRNLVVKYYFSSYGPGDDFQQIDSDVLSAAVEYLQMVTRIVSECFNEFNYLLDEDVYFSDEGLRRNSMSIEDIEEMLGFPRGWTNGISYAERLRLLEEAIPPKMAEWIGKKILSVEDTKETKFD